MAQSVTIMGASYPDVPQVLIPKTGGGTATFTDVSGTTATASDVASGKKFYDASGNETIGTATGGGAIVVTTEPDTGGGTVTNITAVDISSDTVDAAHLLYGYTAHDNTGTAITGSYVAPSFTTQTKSATPSETAQDIEPDSGYDGLSKVTVGAISSSYVGSGITRRSSTDLSASGDTVSVPAGYYESAASKAVDSMTLPTATSSSASSGSTTKATVSRSTSDQYINIPTGYNSTAANYKVSAVANGSVTAPSSISGSSATVSTGTNTITLTKSVSVTPSVTTAGYISAGTAGNSSVSLTASVTTKAAATINTSSSDQTIASGTYLTGTQTIKGVTVSGLSADKILSGTTVKVGDANDDDRIASVSGSVVVQHYYTGSSAPSSSLGDNGDIYLQT